MTGNFKGALLMMASMTAFTLNDTCIKVIGGDLPLFQLLLVRAILASAMLLILALATGSLDLSFSRRDWWLVFWRSLAEVLAAFFFLSALINMPIANVSAVLQVLPLTVTAGAALFLGETVGWRRMAAIMAGFLGMLLIVRPGPDGFNIYAGYALAAVLCVTVRDLVVRPMSPKVSATTVSLLSAIAVGVFSGGLTLGTEWVPITPRLWALIVASSVLIVGAYLFSVMVMRVGDIAFIAPFRYTSLLVALIVGLVVFGEWPDPVTLLGAAIVVGSGVFAIYREQVQRRDA